MIFATLESFLVERKLPNLKTSYQISRDVADINPLAHNSYGG
jgi:hypothetical protein